MKMDHVDVNTLLIRVKADRGLLKKLSWSIIDTWNERMMKRVYFTRYVDGNRHNTCPSNLRLCAIQDILLNFREWTVDWDRGLTADEIELVATTNWIDAVREHVFGSCHSGRIMDPMTVRRVA